MSKRYLILEDGQVFKGRAFGETTTDQIGEVVFQTGMTGYQETLSDPSYCGQMVVMTYPLIGSYGINRDDFETVRPALNALIVKECVQFPSNFRSEQSLDEYLKQKNVPGIEGVDTRRLVRHIRERGTMKAIITDHLDDVENQVSQLVQTPLRNDQVSQVSSVKPYIVPGRGRRLILVDYGMKHGILRELTERGCHVTVVPYNVTADELLQMQPDGVVLSNGPGNPKDVPEGVELVKNLIGKLPIFGICLGHQLIALACGANTEGLKFGHRGCNHPVRDLKTGEVWMTSQNHGYSVSEASVNHTPLKITHVAINDGTVEGLAHTDHPVYSVQFHPESSPGPQDCHHLFDQFLTRIEEEQNIGGVKTCQNVQTFVGS
ncbi:carbamoyl phosphate synthase small subunit [Alkalibacillus aidingensis]|uniref:carbamoyl phosphate synthase small subunit n=1 Tax=Alkalibacillus aidingensis TaxID=2747607 RepID=UPI00166068A7|nr:carbamoyl phosphate synthase small subunit [Alkalibacillus aidingensis]